MKRIVYWAASALLAVLASIQFATVDRTNPPVEAEISAPPEVQTILRRVCYDCHSYETVWPWYSRVAPMSWLVARDVNEGRAELNFSVWGKYPEEKRAKNIREIGEEVEEGEMPLWPYLLAHPEAQLSAEEKAALLAWARAHS